MMSPCQAFAVAAQSGDMEAMVYVTVYCSANNWFYGGANPPGEVVNPVGSTGQAAAGDCAGKPRALLSSKRVSGSRAGRH